MPLRILLSLACLAAAAAFVLQHRELDRCEAARTAVFAATQGEGRDREAQAIDDLREHCRGTTGILFAARSLQVEERDAQALPLAREAVEAEPGNAVAWRLLAAVSDGAESREALARLRALDPRSLKRRSGRSTR